MRRHRWFGPGPGGGAADAETCESALTTAPERSADARNCRGAGSAGSPPASALTVAAAPARASSDDCRLSPSVDPPARQSLFPHAMSHTGEQIELLSDLLDRAMPERDVMSIVELDAMNDIKAVPAS